MVKKSLNKAFNDWRDKAYWNQLHRDKLIPFEERKVY